MKGKRQMDKQVLAITLVVVFLFTAVFVLIGFAFYRMNYIKNYMRQSGVNLTGTVTVYAQVDGEKYLLSHDNSNRLARMLVIGTINLKRPKNKTTGNSIVLTSIDNTAEGVKRITTIEELTNDRILVTLENENGKRQVVLDDVTYFSARKIILETGEEATNKKVDTIP